MGHPPTEFRRWGSGRMLGAYAAAVKARGPRMGVDWGPQGGEDMSEELATKVQELIDSTINPAVAGHGGFVQLIEVKDNKVYLQMGGGCHAEGRHRAPHQGRASGDRGSPGLHRPRGGHQPLLHAGEVATERGGSPPHPTLSPNGGESSFFSALETSFFRPQSQSRTASSAAST